jgi:gliding motility-associated-like protein
MSVNVNEQSYVYRMRGIDNCNDTTPWSNFSQTILLSGRFDKASNKPALSWNFYKEWGQGIVRYEIDRMLPNGVFETIASVSNSVNTYIDYSAESGCVPHYIYRVRAISAWHSTYDTLATSTSNHAQVWPESHLFMPNAFSPDLNNINEKFGPNGQYIVKYHISIYNRWGEKLFDSNTCMDAWDGTYKNERCQQDVYMYRIEAVGADNKTYNLHGTFTLLR